MRPQEIRNREFTRSIRGYNTTEVDEYIDFLADAVSLLQRENDELERKLTIAIKKLEELQERESSITRLDTEMRRAAARLLRQAETQRDHILADARAEADRILQDTEAKAALQRKLCAAMQKEIAQFKDELYNRYGQHIDQLEKIALATARMSFGEVADATPTPAVPEVVEETPAVEEVEEFEDAPAVEEIEEFEDAPAGEEVEEFEDAPAVEEVEEFEDAPAVEEVEEFEDAPAVEEVEEFEGAPAEEEVEEFEDAPAVEEVEEFEDAPAVEEVEEFEDAPAEEEVEQLNLFEAEDDTDDIHREIAEIIGGDALFTDYTDTICEDTLDTGYTLILPTDTDPVPVDEIPREADTDEDASADTEEYVDEDDDTDEDDALLLQNLRRAFSVEFETFDSKKTAKKPSEEEEFSFVENEAPKKRGFLSRLIGGDSDN